MAEINLILMQQLIIMLFRIRTTNSAIIDVTSDGTVTPKSEGKQRL